MSAASVPGPQTQAVTGRERNREPRGGEQGWVGKERDKIHTDGRGAPELPPVSTDP